MKIPNKKISNSNGIFQFVFFIVVLFNSNLIFAQFNIPEKPEFQTSVYDYANMLKADEKAALEEKLIKYSDSTTTQIVVITIESLKGEDIGILTPKWAHEWGLGQAKEDNGVLILIAKAERKTWISVGYGLDDRLTAGIGGEITRNIINPEFKKGLYYKGLDKGTDAIIDVFKGKYKGERKQNKGKGKGFPIFPLIVIVIILVVLITRNRNGGGNSGHRGVGPSLLDIIILSSLGGHGGHHGHGGFGGSSGGGGGFGGGFGGGGFSGGGSGGDW